MKRKAQIRKIVLQMRVLQKNNKPITTDEHTFLSDVYEQALKEVPTERLEECFGCYVLSRPTNPGVIELAGFYRAMVRVEETTRINAETYLQDTPDRQAKL